MRTRELVKMISAAAKAQGIDFAPLPGRNRGGHTTYSLDGLRIPIPRHTEVGNMFAERVFKECEPKLGKGWWR